MFVTKFLPIAMLLVSLTYTTFVVRYADHRAQPTFHIDGTVRTYAGPTVPGAEVSFQGDKISKTVFADDEGSYHADLPVGLYTMTAEARRQDRRIGQFQPMTQDVSQTTLQQYRRPVFRVTSSASLTLNVILDPADPICDYGALASGQVPGQNDSVMVCGGWDLFPIPSHDDVEFPLFIRFRTRRNAGGRYTYNTGKSVSRFDTQVFVAYNLFTLRADRVVYEDKSRKLEANGNVVATSENGEARRADSMTFKIESGQATLLR